MQEQGLVTPKEAASRLYVTIGMIAYWIRKGRLHKHYLEGNTRNYLVDLEEAKRAANWHNLRYVGLPEHLVTPSEAADAIGVGTREIGYYARMGYIQKHYVLGNNHHYLVDINEVLEQPERIAKMYRSEERKAHLRMIAKAQPRDKTGRLFVRRSS
jgi:DNA-binding transcriptional MerR regulator